jgi:hypothetical protein
MKSIIVAAAFLATVGAAWGQDMMPNVTLDTSLVPIITIRDYSVVSTGECNNTLAYTVEVAVVTNTFQPVQYQIQNSGIAYCDGTPWVTPSDGGWTDQKPWYGDVPGFTVPTRPNPNVRITEVREIRTLCFTFEEKPYRIELHNKVLSTKTERREVKQEERWVE